jgi:lysophospholipase L1-like esterase
LDRAYARPPELALSAAAAELMAEDGFHPGAAGYALWGRHLAAHLARRWKRLERATSAL